MVAGYGNIQVDLGLHLLGDMMPAKHMKENDKKPTSPGKAGAKATDKDKVAPKAKAAPVKEKAKAKEKAAPAKAKAKSKSGKY